MTGFELFKKRLQHHYRFYNRLRHTTVDWTVWVYIFIPFFIVGASFYIDLWLKVPIWPENVSAEFMLMVVVFLMYLGSHYAFLFNADVLYLWQKIDLINALNRYRIGYMALITFVKTSLFMILVSPIFIQYFNWDALTYLKFSILVYILSTAKELLKREAKIRLSKWTYRFSILLLMIVYFLMLLKSVTNDWAMLMVSIVILVSSMVIVLSKPQKFYLEIEIDTEQRNQFTQLILMQSAHIGAPEWMTQSNNQVSKRPWIFRNSQKLYSTYTPQFAYQELMIKTLLRRKKWVLLYLQFTFGGVALIVLFPSWYKVLIYLILLFFIGQLARSYWNQIVSERFLELFYWKPVELSNVSKKMFRLMMVPSSLLFSIALGYKLFSYVGIITVPIIGFILSFIIADFFSRRVIINI